MAETSPQPRVAQVMVLRNEERFLRENLAYHRSIGVGRFYLFLDNCTDHSLAIAESFPEAHIAAIPDFVQKDYYYFSDLQCWCHDKALELARSEKMDWLLGLDPDEFAFADNPPGRFSQVMGAACAGRTPEPLQKAHLIPLLQSLPPDCEMVSLRTRESIPIDLPKNSHFFDQVYFQGALPLKRSILNPVTHQEILWEDVLGHKAGKSLVRTSADVQAKSPHTWTIQQHVSFPKRPKKIPFPFVQAGWHYHFLIVSPEHWLEKYTKFQKSPKTWNGGKPVEFPKLSWIQATQELGRDDALAYARRYAFLDPEQASLLAAENAIARDETLREIGSLLNRKA